MEGNENFWIELYVPKIIRVALEYSRVNWCYLEGIWIPRNARPWLNYILTCLQDVLALDNNLKGWLNALCPTERSNDSDAKYWSNWQRRKKNCSYTKLQSFHASLLLLCKTGTVSTGYLELVFYVDINNQRSYVMMTTLATVTYPVLPCLGPLTIVVIDPFDLQGGSREGFTPNNRLWLVVIVIFQFIDSTSIPRRTGALHKQRKATMHCDWWLERRGVWS